jgi:Tol biopolymer transport system component
LVISPNPFSFETTIKFYQIEYGRSEISLFDLQGRKIKTIAERNFETGNHQLMLDRKELANGIYFLKLVNGEMTNTIKLIVQSR